jgi:integrase
MSAHRLSPVAAAGPGEISLAAAVDAFVARRELAATSSRSYAKTLGRLVRELGPERPVAGLAAGELAHAAELAFGTLAPATWNRHVATLRSFERYCAARGWQLAAGADALERRREPDDRTRAIPYPALERLFSRPGLAVRERALWRLLYESAGRASEVLGIDVEQLDLDNRRARVRSKGGAIDWLYFQTGAARLLPRLIAGRSTGPLFLAERAPAPARVPAARDLDPSTGHARLSYRRAAEIFAAASGGWTLHQLRHSAITHLAEAGVGLPLLMAKSRHTSLRSLQRYARPGPEAVAALTAEHDPARRR